MTDKKNVMTIKMADGLIAEFEEYVKSGEQSDEKNLEFAERIMEFEETLNALGIDEGLDTVEGMAENIKNEPSRVLRWLEEREMDWNDEIRGQKMKTELEK